MDAGAIIALAALVVTILIAVFGAIIRWLAGQVAEQKRLNESQRVEYTARLNVAEQTADARRETIVELKRQLDKLEITAEIQNRLLNQLPRHLPAADIPSGDR